MAGEDELVEAEAVVFLDAVRDLLVAADQRGAGATAHEPDARPEVWCHDQAVAPAAVQGGHTLLAH